MIQKKIRTAEIINLGSAYAYYDLYYYKGISVKCINLAGLPQYLNYDLKYVEKYKRYFRKGAKILIVLPDFVFAVDAREQSKKNKSYYYKFFPWEIDDFSLKDFLITWALFLPRKFKHKCGIIYRNARFRLTGKYHVLTQEQKRLEGIKRTEGWMRNLHIPSVRDGNVPEAIRKNINVNVGYLNLIIDGIKEVECDPVIIIPPVSHIMNELVTRECMEAYLFSPIDARKDKDVPVLNYLYDSRFQSDELYRNADWMNHKGGRLFVDVVLHDLGFPVPCIGEN